MTLSRPSLITIATVFCVIFTSLGFTQSADDQLFDAIRKEYVDGVKKVLEEGSDPNAANEEGITPLVLAAYRNDDPAIVLELVTQGADPNVASAMPSRSGKAIGTAYPLQIVIEREKSPAFIDALNAKGTLTFDQTVESSRIKSMPIIMSAARMASAEVWGSLLENGAGVNDRGDIYINPSTFFKDLTPLSYAVVNKRHPDFIKFLLDEGADPNLAYSASRQDKWTPLLCAASNGDAPVAEQLLAHGADAATTNSLGLNAAYYAINTSSYRIYSMLKSIPEEDAERLLRLPDYGKAGQVEEAIKVLDEFDLKKHPELQQHVVYGFARGPAADQLLPRFFEEGFSLNQQFGSGDSRGTALLPALIYQNVQAVQTLIDLGVDVDAEVADGYPPFIFAANIGRLDIVKLFVENGAVLNNHKPLNETYCHRIADNPDIFHYLESKGWEGFEGCNKVSEQKSISQQDIQLFDGIHEKDIEKVRKALEDGADPNAVDTQNISAVVYAIQRDVDPTILSELVKQGADPNALSFSFVDCMEESDRTTPAHVAADLRKPVAFLDALNAKGTLDFNPTANFESFGEVSLLAKVCYDGNALYLEEMLNHGVKADRLVSYSAFGDVTPLHLTLLTSGNSECVKLLLANGADPNAAIEMDEVEGVTPLMTAVSLGNEDSIWPLIAAGADVETTTSLGMSALDLAALFLSPETCNQMKAQAERSSDESAEEEKGQRKVESRD